MDYLKHKGGSERWQHGESCLEGECVGHVGMSTGRELIRRVEGR